MICAEMMRRRWRIATARNRVYECSKSAEVHAQEGGGHTYLKEHKAQRERAGVCVTNRNSMSGRICVQVVGASRERMRFPSSILGVRA